jgi:hypothetical protein
VPRGQRQQALPMVLLLAASVPGAVRRERSSTSAVGPMMMSPW